MSIFPHFPHLQGESANIMYLQITQFFFHMLVLFGTTDTAFLKISDQYTYTF